MRILFAVVSFALATMFLGYFGLTAFVFGQSVYDAYPIDLSSVVWNNDLLAFFAFMGAGLVLGAAFLVGGIVVLSKPRRQN